MNFETVLMTFHSKSDECIAKESLEKANELIAKFNVTQVRTEEDLRLAMKLFLDAFWVFKDIRKEISKVIHKLGLTLEQDYKCKYHFDQDKQEYYTICPAILLHNDFGFSMRGSEKYKCSICGLPIIECEHITGEYYDDVTCKKTENLCNICRKENCDEHIEGNQYNHVVAVKIVYDINIVTFDIVKDPEMKFSRMSKIYLPRNEVEKSIHSDDKQMFVYGESNIYCHHCTQCKRYIPTRFDEMFDKDK